MASHYGKRRSHQRFLRNLPKQKPGKYLKVILSSVADPNLELGKWRERGRFFSLSLPAFLSSVIILLFFFFTQNKEEEGARVPRAPPLDPPAATDLARVGLKHWLHICYSV